MAHNGNFKRGKRAFPLDPASTESLLFDADPFIFYALEFFAAMIERHVGPRLMAAAAGMTKIPAPVAYTAPIDPLPYLGQQVHYKFPLLAVYRKNGRLRDRTVGWRGDASTFEVAYILPPLTAGEAERIVPILTAIRDVLDDRATYGGDQSFTPTGGTPDDSLWIDVAGVEKVEFREAEWGVIPGNGGLAFFALRMRGEVCEREDTPTTGTEPFEGVDLVADLPAADGSVLPAVAEVATHPAPTILFVTPSSGNHTGELIEITGTHFHAPARVYVGGVLAHDVIFDDDETIACVTPAFDASAIGTALDVRVETDFGEATSAAAFTLTA